MARIRLRIKKVELNIDKLVKIKKVVIPAKAGIQKCFILLDSCLRRNDGSIAIFTFYELINIKLLALLIASLMLWGMSGGCSKGIGGGGGNPDEGLNLTRGQLGFSGGFVDVDGDGVTDKVVGAPYADVSSHHADASSHPGALIVYRGNSSGSFSTSRDIILTGDDNFGYSFLNPGDVDGDSMDDFAVAAINGDGDSSSLCGAVYIYKGGSSGQTVIKKLAGEKPMDKFGFSIASGDLNADGKKDIIIGAPFNTSDPSVYAGGAVYIYFGPDFAAQAALRASSKNKGLGWRVAAGDINNDNVPDLLISASGKVLGYYGGSSFAPDIDSPDLTVASSASGFGKVITVIGDVDSDGFREMAIAAPNAVINNNRDTGSMYIIKGGGGARAVNLNLSPAPSDLIVRIDGANLFDRFGSSIAIVDADGDALPDIAVGAPTADADKTLIMSGKVYLFKGKDIGLTTALANATVFNGNKKDQGYGTFLAPAPDARLLIGTPWLNKYSGEAGIIDLASGEVVTDDIGDGTTEDGDTHEHDHH